jgi:hypothetical protein
MRSRNVSQKHWYCQLDCGNDDLTMPENPIISQITTYTNAEPSHPTDLHVVDRMDEELSP